MNTAIKNYFKAGYSGLFLTSYEEQRVEAELAAIAKEINFEVYVWTITDSLVGPIGSEKPVRFDSDDSGPLGIDELMDKMAKLPENTIVIAKDAHLFLGEPNPILIRKVKDCLSIARTTNRRLVILGCRFTLCAELEKEFTVVEFALPDREQLKLVATGIAESAKITLNGSTDQIIDAACGMTTTEAADAFALAVVESGGAEIKAEVVAREKAGAVRKNGILEIVEQKMTLDDIGGLERLKAELWEKRNLFTKQAKDYGLSSPRGVLVCGQAGVGKSLTATACGTIFNVPLVRLEAGRLFGSLVGESEGNWRKAFATLKAIAPVIGWIDEADGLFSGGKSSGQTDGGTTSRVLKAILQDMQYHSDGIFYFFTANDIDGFPDPLIDRLDVWSVDLPNNAERQQVWKIHIAKRKRNPEVYDLPALAAVTEGFSGRQIEQVWLKAMTIGFNDNRREPTQADVIAAASKFVATSVTMGPLIEARRKRLEGRAQPAGIPEVQPVQSKGRKLSV